MSTSPLRRALRRRARDERGAAAVEFALVSLLLFMLVFGIIEFGLALRDNVAVSSAVRTAGRVASAEPIAGPATCKGNPLDPMEPPCAPTSAPKLAQDAANAIERAGTAMPLDSIEELWIYRANSNGFPGSTTQITSGTCTAANRCVRFRWIDGSGFSYVGGGWNSTTINACAQVPPGSDAVGVYMRARHQFLTGMFGATIDITDRAVFKFEPQDPELCAAGTHA